ncbi:MAG: ATP-binding protein [Thermodesulfobacteriota bacterium]|nr:ATP-binding protein [Thermodesulfobacteriota bacterium]
MEMSPNKTHAQPPHVERMVDLTDLLGRKSHFLFGPRQTGKTFLMRHTLEDCRIYDLLDSSIYLSLSRNPGRIAEEVRPEDRVVVIDEIQRIPELLNEVHRLIEERGMRFLLTGSSARKLLRGGVNFLAGRARTKNLHPLTSRELGEAFDPFGAIARGLLPSIYFSEDPRADLEAYAGSYLQQEIVAEGFTRNIAAFSRFLRVAALCNGRIVNFTNVANDAQVPRTTVYEYFEILKDTLILHELPAWRKSGKRKPLASSKFYFFDIGVVSALQGREFRPGTAEFGEAFETYIFHELVCYRDYMGADALSYWRSTSGFEVDFVIGDHTAIEAKAKENLSAAELKSLRALAEEKKLKRFLCVSLEPRRRKIGDVTVLPYEDFLQELWSGEYC